MSPSAGAVTSLPLSQMFAWGPITVEGRVPPPGEKFINADVRMVSGHYFQAMEIPLREGRLFNDDDVAEQTSGGDCRRLHGATTLAKPGPDWQAPAHWRHQRDRLSVDHGCRRGRPREAIHPRLGFAHRVTTFLKRNT